MKEIKLISLVLRDFKGGTFELSAGGHDTDVYGDNGKGKTRLADAWSWLLFGKDSLGRADFPIKNLDAHGEAAHGLEHTVEGVLQFDHSEVTLKKVYKEVWTKKRGNTTRELTGNTTDYYIDGVPKKEKEYVELVAELTHEEAIFRLLTSPTAFAMLHWQKARGILLEVCGGMTDEEVIEADPTLAPLTTLLERYKNSKDPFDDMKAVITSRRTTINKEIEKIPVRIDEVRRGLPDIGGLNRQNCEAEVTRLETDLNDAKLRLQGIDTGGDIAELTKKLNLANLDVAALEGRYYREGMTTVNKLTQGINEITERKNREERIVKSIKDDIDTEQKKINILETQLNAIRDKWYSIDAELFTDTTEDTCPACGQALPPERVQEAREKALANFNRSKAERLTEIETDGYELNMQLHRIKKDVEDLNESLLNRPNVATDQLESLIAERDSMKAQVENYDLIPGRAELEAQAAEIKAEIEAARGTVAVDRGKINQEVTVLTTMLASAREIADRFRQREQGENRIEELKTEEKKLAAEFEKLEQELYLCESFIKIKASLLTDRINSRFGLVSFKLFDTQVNGGISECCEMMVDGVPFHSALNSGARTNAGLDVCRTLARHYGLLAPIFVDNAESVCELIPMDAQVIRLVVSEKDKTLRVETAKKRMAA